MLGVTLALSASLMWGFADYLGGLQTRTRQVFAVVLVSQLAGLAVITCVVAVRGVGWPGATPMLPAAIAGVIGAVCIVVFYLALSYGPVSIVAPILASSACIPVVYGLIRGERPSDWQLAGLAATLAGVVLVSWTQAGDHHARGRRGIAFGVLAAVLLGTLLVIFSSASDHDAYWAPFVLRVFSLGTIAVVVLVRRVAVTVDRRGVLLIAIAGTLDVCANLYSVATTLQLLSITAVLSSLFPIVTVALARIHLGERVTRIQEAGAVLTMAGVLAVAAG